jgi:hypothetical protein
MIANMSEEQKALLVSKQGEMMASGLSKQFEMMVVTHGNLNAEQAQQMQVAMGPLFGSFRQAAMDLQSGDEATRKRGEIEMRQVEEANLQRMKTDQSMRNMQEHYAQMPPEMQKGLDMQMESYAQASGTINNMSTSAKTFTQLMDEANEKARAAPKTGGEAVTQTALQVERITKDTEAAVAAGIQAGANQAGQWILSHPQIGGKLANVTPTGQPGELSRAQGGFLPPAFMEGITKLEQGTLHLKDIPELTAKAVQSLVTSIKGWNDAIFNNAQINTPPPVTPAPPATPPHRAAGGPVDAGTVYQVGEEGTELFKPKVSGEVISNEQTVALMKNAQNGMPNFDGMFKSMMPMFNDMATNVQKTMNDPATKKGIDDAVKQLQTTMNDPKMHQQMTNASNQMASSLQGALSSLQNQFHPEKMAEQMKTALPAPHTETATRNIQPPHIDEAVFQDIKTQLTQLNKTMSSQLHDISNTLAKQYSATKDLNPNLHAR